MEKDIENLGKDMLKISYWGTSKEVKTLAFCAFKKKLNVTRFKRKKRVGARRLTWNFFDENESFLKITAMIKLDMAFRL